VSDAAQRASESEVRAALVQVALRDRPADLVVRGGRLVNVFTGEVHAADVAIAHDRIAVVGDVDGTIDESTTVVEADGRHMVPGFIDCHIHVGASSLTMTELARLLVARGTAAIVTDFTEAGKMRGPDAIRFFLDEAAHTPLGVYLSPFFTTLAGIEGRPGASLDDLERMLDWPETLELREWSVYAHHHPDPTLRGLADVARAHGVALCGHMQHQQGRTLQASVATGVTSDHEAGTMQEAIDRLRLGIALQIRFSSAADDMRDTLRAIVEQRLDSSLVMFATDEEDVDDIATLGHIDHRVRLAIELGVPPIEAVRMASLNAARHLGVMSDLGGIAPGRKAFINLVDDLRRFAVREVIADGAVVARDGRYLTPIEPPAYPASFRDTVRIGGRLDDGHFAVAAQGVGEQTLRVIGVAPFDVHTTELHLPATPREGHVHADPERDLAKIAVIERHTEAVKVGLGFVQGFGLRRGAFGSSYHPGPVQIGVVGTNDRDMRVVAERIEALQGGFVVAQGGAVLAEVPLPLLGFLSERPAEEVVDAFRHVKGVLRDDLGCGFAGLFTALAYVCMPGVLPELRIGTNGMVRVELGDRHLSVTPVTPLDQVAG
jgi:adenine deaminase